MSCGSIIVLGASGYLGGKVARLLLAEGRDVICTSRHRTSKRTCMPSGGSSTWISTSAEAVAAACACENVDAIVNMLADYGHQSSTTEVASANIMVPLACLEAAMGAGVRRFVSVGTPLPRDLSSYAATKSAFADIARLVTQDKKITFINVLPEMFYGADEPAGRFLSSTARRMVEGLPVETTVGSQRRDIVRAIDVACAVSAIACADIEGYTEIPVGTGVAPTIAEIIDYMHELTQRRSSVAKGARPQRKGEPDSVADISVLSTLMDWNPMPWQGGIAQMIQKIEAEISNAVS